MALEFHKLSEQISQMGEYLAAQDQDMEGRLEIALQIAAAYADEAFLPYIRERVGNAVARDAGYRGANPLDEPIMAAYDPAPLPPTATVIATDGSQIYPRRHVTPHYYLINIGTIVNHHGSGGPPDVFSEPYIFFEREYVYPHSNGEPISAITVNARRTIYEMSALAEHAWLRRDEARPLLALLDGPLLFVMGNEVPERDQLRQIYFSAMTRLYEVSAGLAGYIDRPNSSFVIRMLHLLDLPEEEVSRRSLSNSGRLEGLRDAPLFGRFLGPGQRSALFVQMSPQNKGFRQQGGETHEITFFYLNAAGPGEGPKLARVEVPMWVAGDRVLVAEMQALIYQQCQQLMRRYPYVLTRADELAVVKNEEARQLKVLIDVAAARHGVKAGMSEKEALKQAARARKTSFEVKGRA
jgi:hypothetical protein